MELGLEERRGERERERGGGDDNKYNHKWRKEIGTIDNNSSCMCLSHSSGSHSTCVGASMRDCQ